VLALPLYASTRCHFMLQGTVVIIRRLIPCVPNGDSYVVPWGLNHILAVSTVGSIRWPGIGCS